MNSVSIYIGENSSKRANKLLGFLNRNLEDLIMKNNYCFNIDIVKKKELNDYERKGIKDLPTLICDREKVSGYDDIFKFLKAIQQRQNLPRAPREEPLETEDYHSILLRQLVDTSDDTGNNGYEEVNTKRHMDQLSRMQIERNLDNQNNKPRIQTPVDDFIQQREQREKAQREGTQIQNFQNQPAPPHNDVPVMQQNPEMRDFSRPGQRQQQKVPPIKIPKGRVEDVDIDLTNYMDSQTESFFS